jgi:hypothetical protein
MGWGIIQMKVSFLDALTMISLGIRQSKQALFQEVVFLVPKRKSDIF